MTIMSASRVQQNLLENTYCSRGHVHPPWNTTGVLRIAKCESVCGFCKKETKTAANLRKHVAIHIKNEGLNLTIAEGSSGRGRLEMPPSELERRPSPNSAGTATASSSSVDFSAPAALLSMSHPSQQQHSYASSSSGYPTSTHSTPSPISTSSHLSYTASTTTTPLPYHTTSPSSLFPQSQPLLQKFHPQMDAYPPATPHLPLPNQLRTYRQQTDPFHALRTHNLHTKPAWTAIPAVEGQRILEICKRNSVVDHPPPSSFSPSLTSSSSSRKGSLVVLSPTNSMASEYSPQSPGGVGSGEGGNGSGSGHIPCYNRKILYDEEWQAHMRDVHGVFLLWPDTWMKRVEVLDLDPFGGDIGACNGVIMDG